MRAVWTILFAGLILFPLSGCNRRGADPLEWRLQGRTPLKLQNWVDETLRRMQPDLAKEYTASLVTILNQTRRPNTQLPDDSTDPLCLRLDQRTVREIMIEAHELELNQLRNAMSIEYTNLTRLVQRASEMELTTAREENLAHRKERSQSYI